MLLGVLLYKHFRVVPELILQKFELFLNHAVLDICARIGGFYPR